MFLNIAFPDSELTPAFMTAAQALSQAQPTFHPQQIPEMVSLASAIHINSPDEVKISQERQAGLNRWGTYHGHRLHAKYLFDAARPPFSSHHLYEGLVACLAFDMGFPVTAQALATDPESKKLYRIGLDPFAASQTMEDFLPAYTGQATQPATYYPERLGHFMMAHPHLLPALMALTLQDLWSANGDRHTKNILIDRPPDGTSSPRALCGIDQTDKEIPLATNQAAKRLVQGPAIHDLPTHLLHADQFRPALATLESYPVAHIAHIPGTLAQIYAQSRATNRPTHEVADALALHKLSTDKEVEAKADTGTEDATE